MKPLHILTCLTVILSLNSLRLNAQCVTYAGPDSSVCGNTATLNGEYSHNAGSTIEWVCNYPGVIISDPHSLTPVVTIPPFLYSTTVDFILNEENLGAPCFATDTVKITFVAAPHSEAGPDESICGTMLWMIADTIGSNMVSGYWTCSVPGIIITSLTGPVLQYSITADASAVTASFVNGELPAWFYWHGTNLLGCESVDSLLARFYLIPVANGGVDDTICGANYALSAQTSVDSSWTYWSCIYKPSASATAVFANPASPVSDIQVSQYGLYGFIWAEHNGANTGCYDNDTVWVIFLDVPHPDAGPDQAVCGSWVHLQGSAINSGNVSWSSALSAWYDTYSGTFCPTCGDSLDVWAYYSSENDTVQYILTEYNWTCYSSDTVLIYFASIQTALELTVDGDVCGMISSELNALQPAYGYGHWIDNTPGTIFYPSATTANPDSAVIAPGTAGMHTFYWITTNGPCMDYSDPVYLNFNASGGAKGFIGGTIPNPSEISINVYNSSDGSLAATSPLGALNSYSVYGLDASGTYYFKAKNTDPSVNTGLPSTYYGDSWTWEQAQLVTIAACDTADMNWSMQTYNPNNSGYCTALGGVMYDNGSPVPDADVYLQSEPQDTLAGHTLTESNGHFILHNIPVGDYKLYVEIPVLPMITTHYFTVTPADSMITNLSFIVDTTAVKDYGFGIYADTTSGVHENGFGQILFNVYPNPAQTYFVLESPLLKEKPVLCELYNANGSLVFIRELNPESSSVVFSDIAVLTPGVYYLKVTSGNTIYVKKIIRE